MTHASPLARFARLRAVLGLALVLVFAVACDSTSSLTSSGDFAESADASAEALAIDAGLSADGQAALASSFANHSDTTKAGRLWLMAAELQQNLDDDQKARLIERGQTFTLRGQKPGGQRPGADTPRRGGRLAGALADSLGLSDEQKETIKGIYETHRPQVQALREQRRDGTLDAEAFEAAMTELKAEIEAAVADVLTAEQQARLDQLKAAREARQAERAAERDARQEATRTIMLDVLGLTETEAATLDALRGEHRAAMRELFESFRSQDNPDREAAKAAAEALHAEQQAALADVLDETQLEIIYIHRALAQHVRKHRGGQGGRGGDGQRPGPGRRG